MNKQLLIIAIRISRIIIAYHFDSGKANEKSTQAFNLYRKKQTAAYVIQRSFRAACFRIPIAQRIFFRNRHYIQIPRTLEDEIHNKTIQTEWNEQPIHAWAPVWPFQGIVYDKCENDPLIVQQQQEFQFKKEMRHNTFMIIGKVPDGKTQLDVINMVKSYGGHVATSCPGVNKRSSKKYKILSRHHIF